MKFAKQLREKNLEFHLISVKGLELLQTAGAIKFDRVDATGVTSHDLSEFGTVLKFYGLLLKSFEVNKHATLFTFISNYDEYLDRSDEQMRSENQVQVDLISDFAEMMYPDPDPSRVKDARYDPYLFRLDEIKLYLLKDWKSMLKRYEKDAQLKLLGRAGNVRRRENKIVELLPFMVLRDNGIPEVWRHLGLMALGRRWGSECYLEWQRPRNGLTPNEPQSPESAFKSTPPKSF